MESLRLWVFNVLVPRSTLEAIERFAVPDVHSTVARETPGIGGNAARSGQNQYHRLSGRCNADKLSDDFYSDWTRVILTLHQDPVFESELIDPRTDDVDTTITRLRRVLHGPAALLEDARTTRFKRQSRIAGWHVGRRRRRFEPKQLE